MQNIKTGLYITRCGLIVDLYEVKNTSATFNRHGYIYQTHTKKGEVRCRGVKREWGIWNDRGFFTAFEGHAYDLVERLPSREELD